MENLEVEDPEAKSKVIKIFAHKIIIYFHVLARKMTTVID